MRLGEVMSSSPGLKKSQDIVVLFSGAPDSSHSRGTVGGKAHAHTAQAGSTGADHTASSRAWFPSSLREASPL